MMKTNKRASWIRAIRVATVDKTIKPREVAVLSIVMIGNLKRMEAAISANRIAMSDAPIQDAVIPKPEAKPKIAAAAMR